MKRKITIAFTALWLLLIGLLILSSIPSRWRFKHDHGLQLPERIDELRMCGDLWFLPMDHGRVAFIVLNDQNCSAFLSQLKPEVVSTSRVSSGDPGSSSEYFSDMDGYPMPSNGQYVRFQRYWGTNVTPLKAFGGRSNTGDSLRVEHWRLADGRNLVKIYTDWN